MRSFKCVDSWDTMELRDDDSFRLKLSEDFFFGTFECIDTK